MECEIFRISPLPPATRSYRGGHQHGPQLLLAADGSHAGKGEKVDHLEVAGRPIPGWQRRPPPRIGTQIGTRVELQHPDEDFTHDAATNRPQMRAICHAVTFPEGVEPQRRRLVETKAIRLELAQVLLGQGRRADFPGDSLARREGPGDVTEQVPRRQ